MVPATSIRIPRDPTYSGGVAADYKLPVRDFHPLRHDFPDTSRSSSIRYASRSYNPDVPASTSVWALPLSLAATRRIDSFFLFLQVLRCFSSLRSLHATRHGDEPSTRRVSPFGHARINSCLPIPAPFRSLPRPSSPPEAQASSVRPPFSFSHSLSES